jgi:hypothetical protein
MKLTKIFLLGALFCVILFTGCGEDSGTNTDLSTQGQATKNADMQMYYTIDRVNSTLTAHLKGVCELVNDVPVWNSDFTMDQTALGFTLNNDTIIIYALEDSGDYSTYHARVSGSPGSMEGRWKEIGFKDLSYDPELILIDSIEAYFIYMDISGDTIKRSKEMNPDGDFILTIGTSSILEDIFRLQDNPEAVLSEEVWVDGFYITSRDMDLIHVFFKDFDILDQSNKSITFARKGMQFSALVKETVWISYSQSFGLQVSGNGKTCDFNSIEGSVESTEMCKAENASILSFSNNTLGMYSQNNSTEFLNCLRSMF